MTNFSAMSRNASVCSPLPRKFLQPHSDASSTHRSANSRMPLQLPASVAAKSARKAISHDMCRGAGFIMPEQSFRRCYFHLAQYERLAALRFGHDAQVFDRGGLVYTAFAG